MSVDIVDPPLDPPLVCVYVLPYRFNVSSSMYAQFEFNVVIRQELQRFFKKKLYWIENTYNKYICEGSLCFVIMNLFFWSNDMLLGNLKVRDKFVILVLKRYIKVILFFGFNCKIIE